MKNSINLRFLLASLAGFILLGAGVYFLHEFQLHRQAPFTLSRARHAREEKRFEPAVRDYQAYLSMAPKDAAAQAEFGLLLADLGNAYAASLSLETALRLAPEREDLRKRLVEVDIVRGRYGDAREHLLRLLASSSSDGKLWEQLGICQAAGGDDSSAVQSWEKAIKLDPAGCESYARIASALHRAGRAQEAEAWMAKMVATNPESPQAHSLRAKYLAAGSPNSLTPALVEAEKAAALAPQDFDILLLAADLSTAAGDYEKARGYAKRAIAGSPQRAGGYRAVFQIEARQGDAKKALVGLRHGVEKASDPGELLWILGQALIDEGQFAAAHPGPAPLPAKDGQNALKEAQETIARLRRLPQEQTIDPVRIDYLQAEVEAAQGQWLVAAKAFAEVAQALERPDQNLGSTEVRGTWANGLFKDVECRLAICYEQLGDTDAQLTAYRKAAHIDPLWVPARLGVAATLASMGQLNEALAEYRQVGKLEDMAVAADVQIAHLLIIKNLRLRARDRDWRETESILARLAQAAPDAAELALMRAQVLLAEGRNDEAEKQLAAAWDKHPASADLWTALIQLADTQQQSRRAVELLDQAEKKFGDCVWIRLARAGHHLTQERERTLAVAGKTSQPVSDLRSPTSESKRVSTERGKTGQPPAPGTPGRPDAEGRKVLAELAKLGEDTARFSAADRGGLYRGLAVCLWEAGGLEQAKAEAKLACQSDRSNLDSWLLLFELAYQGKDTSAMQGALDEVRTLQGESALWHYGEAGREAILAEGAAGPQDRARLFAMAFAHLAAAQQQRPRWGRIPLSRARLCDQLGQADQAIDNYLKAMDAGESDPAAVRRACELLNSRQRFAEADAMLRRLEERQVAFLPEDLGRVASEVSMRMENSDRALAIARQVAAQSTDWADHFWLGEVVALLGQRAEANQKPKEARDYFSEGEKAFRRAVELSSETPQAWVGLIQFLALSGQKEAAGVVLAEALRKIPVEEASKALAPCYELLGREDEAAAQYQRILAGCGNDPRALRQVAEYCLRTNKPLEAEKHLQRVLDPGLSATPQDVAWARRTMALVLHARGGYANLLKAVELVGQNLAGGHAAEDLRTSALLLASFPQRAKRKEAIAALEELIGLQPSDPAEVRFALANLYLQEKDWGQSRKQMLEVLLSGHGEDPRYVAVFVAMLLEHDELQEAGAWLERLEGMAPDNPSNLDLRMELLVRRQQSDLAIQLLRKRLEQFASPSSQRERSVLQAFFSLKLAAQGASKRGDRVAKKRLLAEMDSLLKENVDRHPALGLLRASVRVLDGRTDEALALAQETWSTAEPQLLAAEFARWVTSAKFTPEQASRFDRLLLAAAEKQGRPPAVLQALGDLRMRYQLQDAAAIYREILQQDADNVVVLNSLALVLALEKRDLQESLKLIDRAISIAGPAAAFLDTRAVVRMANGQPQEALADLEEAIRGEPSPNRCFHEALAFWRLGQKKAANDAFHEAGKQGLKAEDLLGPERADYEGLAREVAR